MSKSLFSEAFDHLIEICREQNGATFSQNQKGLLKEALFNQDERITFILVRRKAYFHACHSSSHDFNPNEHQLNLQRRVVNKSIDINYARVQIDEFLQKYSSDVLASVFANCPLQKGKDVSRKERNLLDNRNSSLTYGEIDFASFYKILRDIPSWCRKNGTFYDLGSGTGRAVLAARMLQDFSVCHGIEILEGLHHEAGIVVENYFSSSSFLQYFGVPTSVNIACGSITDYDWSDGDIVFANSTCFSLDLMQRISDLAERLQEDALVITFTKSLQSEAFEIFKRIRYKMSWGPATVYMHRKKGAPKAKIDELNGIDAAVSDTRWGRLTLKLQELERMADMRP